MTTIRAHFDGRVFVPEEPVNLPPGQTFEMDLREIGTQLITGIRIDKETGRPVFDVPADAKPITLEDVRRAMEDD